jgi:hypothetical protein
MPDSPDRTRPAPRPPDEDRLNIMACTAHFEARWESLRRSSDDVLLTLRIRPEDMPLFLQNMRHGGLMHAAVVELTDDSHPVDRKLADSARRQSQVLRREPRFWAFMMRRYDRDNLILDCWNHVGPRGVVPSIGPFSELEGDAREQMTTACGDALKALLSIRSSNEFPHNLVACETMKKLGREYHVWHPGGSTPYEREP